MRTTNHELELAEMHVARLSRDRRNLDVQLDRYYAELQRIRTSLVTDGPYDAEAIRTLTEWAEQNEAAHTALRNFVGNRHTAIEFSHPDTKNRRPAIRLNVQRDDDPAEIETALNGLFADLFLAVGHVEMRLLDYNTAAGDSWSPTYTLQGHIGQHWLVMEGHTSKFEGTLLEALTVIVRDHHNSPADADTNA